MSATTPSSTAVGGFAREATATPSSFDVDDHHLRRESRFHTPLSATPSVLSDLAGGSSANRDSTKSRGASRWVRNRERETDRERESEKC
jgi:hypothetical protein